ncbi:MAG TPA: ABC transporter substrate-binding protein, partial [Polyangiaceae bacterium]|nr:ABC transporter substrate-binding protein [Polyangiaceae bacterium]
MDQRRPGWQVVGSVLVVGLLGASALQLHAVESRLVTQSQQLRALGETTERVAAQLEHLRSAAPIDTPRRADADTALAEVRHPELKNFLGAKGTHWPPPGAKTTGGIAIDFPHGDPKGFNPLLENGQDVVEKLIPYVESALASRNEWTDPNVFYGDLAWRVEVQDDFKTFTIYLRKGVKWHPASGVDLNSPRYAWLNEEHELTAHDFVFTFDLIMNPQVQNGFLKSYYSELASWKALDDYTLELRWNKTQELNVGFSLEIWPLPKFLFAYQEDGSPIPEATLGVNFNQHWYNNKGMVGTGPYRFARYAPGSQIVLERNEDFYGEHPALASITYRIYSDPAQTALKLKSGELDFGRLRSGQYNQAVLQYENMPEAERPKDYPFLNGDIRCDLVDFPVYYFIGWNEDNPLFSDRRVRRAMTLALNRQQLVDKVFLGMGHVARGPFWEGAGTLDPEIKPLPFDLKQAAALLAEAGWKDTDGDGLLDKA